MGIEERTLGLLGLALRARKVEKGSAAVADAIEQGKVLLLVIASDAAEATVERLTELARKRSVPLLRVASKEELGQLTGREQLAVLGVTDPSFAKGLRALQE